VTDLRETEAEVFIEETPSNDPDDKRPWRSLVIIERNGNMFTLYAKDFVGKITDERKEKLKSIGVFDVHDM
jgi:hypothetical protein